MLAAWVDGVAARSIGLEDRGLHYGDGLFETIGASGHRARFLAAHFARLERGCAALSLPPPDMEPLRSEIAHAAALAPNVVVKLIVTRGAALERGYAFTGTESPTRIVCAFPWPEGPDAERAPARVALAGRCATRPLLAGVKHLNRLEQVLARVEARQRRLDEVILLADGGNIMGGSMTNVFALLRGRLVTPPVESCAVAGVMRAQVLSAAGRLGFPTREGDLTAQDLADAEALWLTNALVGLWPVGTFEDRTFVTHAWTLRLQEAIRHVAREMADA